MGLMQKSLGVMGLKNQMGGTFGAKLMFVAKEIEVPLEELFGTKNLHEAYYFTPYSGSSSLGCMQIRGNMVLCALI